MRPFTFSTIFMFICSLNISGQEMSNDNSPLINPTGAVQYNAPNNTINQNEQYLKMIKNGNDLYNAGRVMAWGGLGLSLMGGIAQVEPLAYFGSAFFTLGIPILGVGASKVDKVASELGNTGLEGGWTIYLTGWVLQIGGAVALVYVMQMDSPDPVALIIPIGVITAGGISHYVAWYKFSEQRDNANAYLKGLRLNPTLNFYKENIRPGCELTIRF